MPYVIRMPFQVGLTSRPAHRVLIHQDTSNSQDSGIGGNDGPGAEIDQSDAEQDLRWEQQVDALLEAAFRD